MLPLVALVSLPTLALAQTAKPKPKTAPPAAPQTGGPIVLGTRQLPGDFGKLGTTYTIGKESPLNLTLTGAEYTTDHWIYESAFAGVLHSQPKADEKFLLMRLTVQNPTQKPLALSPDGMTPTTPATSTPPRRFRPIWPGACGSHRHRPLSRLWIPVCR